ncbi:MAG TPA: OmpH family outer membrane protein [Arachidicoccus soli]|uniref:OmpH family outer membrane protein n=1 Tax=Arachidicoccus soli TaxID=2341117 RepID=A0A386HL69_9BACT|nr:OmpH family outer membrane protein [Arachidicoccus soli]AYD46525.1 OmpH family outer membrane protein [Arachidicoccus soli]HEU0227270.1 OmpH family outer membrane protein [Arachidicoccus soli]
MNKFLVSSNIILIIAVCILFYLQFNEKAQKSAIVPAQQSSSNNVTDNGSFKIGYFELDSLDQNYKYLQDVKSDLIAKDKSVQKQINDLQNEFREKYNEYVQKGPTLSQSEQTEYTQNLNDLQKQNQEKAQRLDQSFSMERTMKLQEIKQRIQDYLKTFAKEKGYNYIIGTNEADYFYYKDSTQDITKELVENLNKSYADSKK